MTLAPSLRKVFAAIVLLLTLGSCEPAEPDVAAGPPVMRRLTEDQYRRVIADVFGADIVVGGRFDPLLRTDGLLVLNAATSAVNTSSYELYDALAKSVAAQVTDPERRALLVPCTTTDDACASAFFTRVGRLLFRRPLSADELKLYVTVARMGTEALGDFHKGLSEALAAMLVAPEFLYVTDQIERDDNHPRLTAYAKAARLSFFLWNTTPDDILLAAAESGRLHTADEVAAQVDRMMASSRFAAGVRAFFSDMLAFDGFNTLQKDSVIYPAFGLPAILDAREQTLRVIVDHLLVRHEDYRGLFTTRRTFVSGPLGMIYRVPADDPEGWAPYEFGEDDQRAGIQSLAAFTALHSHPGRSSATLRGKAVRELLMCQRVPDPPSNVDFTLVSDSTNKIHKTARQRLNAHNTEPSCAGCHKIMDPIGLALENFDGGAQWRTTENEAAIDTSGELDGIPYSDARGLGQALFQSPAVPACLVTRLVSYATGRPADRVLAAHLTAQFAEDKYRLPELVRRIALSRAFFAVAEPQP
jgi:hypothetical protein